MLYICFRQTFIANSKLQVFSTFHTNRHTKTKLNQLSATINCYIKFVTSFSDHFYSSINSFSCILRLFKYLLEIFTWYAKTDSNNITHTTHTRTHTPRRTTFVGQLLSLCVCKKIKWQKEIHYKDHLLGIIKDAFHGHYFKATAVSNFLVFGGLLLAD